MASNGRAPPSPTVLLIPNLFMANMNKASPVARAGRSYDILLERSTKGKPSVVYVEHMPGFRDLYGEPFRDFVSRFVPVME